LQVFSISAVAPPPGLPPAVFMEILFAILVVALLIAAFAGRRRQKKQWLQEERREESGDWIDKRPGERGTWGPLDQERERERLSIARESRITALAELLRNFAIDRYPGFHQLPDDRLRAYYALARTRATEMIAAMEQLRLNRLEEPPAATSSSDPLSPELKKHLLEFAYHNFPDLLNLDIETLRRFDSVAAGWAGGLLDQIRNGF
jgi:hypothetical protein